jgi:hypothetical protein
MKACSTCKIGTTPYCRHVVGILTGSGNVRADVAAWVVRQNAMMPDSKEHDSDAIDDGCPAWEGINTDGVSS